jgi:hypothetical protein
MEKIDDEVCENCKLVEKNKVGYCAMHPKTTESQEEHETKFSGGDLSALSQEE